MLIVLFFISAITECWVVYSLFSFPWRQIEFSPGPFLWSLRVFLIWAKVIFPESNCFALSCLRGELESLILCGAPSKTKKEFALRIAHDVFLWMICFSGVYS